MMSVCSFPGYENATHQWFEPEYWGSRARRVQAGGRGSAWFVSSPLGDWVLRHYRRGGLVARVSERQYLFTGWRHTRSFAEFELLGALYRQGLPVPKPIAAMAERHHLLSYSAAILVERIQGAVPLPEHPDVSNETLWQSVGATIARFHRAGLDHVDLNCDNILISEERVYLIDFDRCRLRSISGTSADWQQGNLKRLRRSVEKRCSQLSQQTIETVWSNLLLGYGR